MVRLRTRGGGGGGEGSRVRIPHGPSDFSQQKISSTLLLFTQVYKWVPVRIVSQCAVAAYAPSV